VIEAGATLVGNPGAYPSGAALAERLRGVDAKRLVEEGPAAPGGATLFYAVSRDFVRRLVDRSGAPAPRAFLADYVRDPSAWRAAFERHFGVPFESAVASFTW